MHHQPSKEGCSNFSSPASVGRIVRKVEDLPIECGKFRLPSQRQLYQPGWEWKVMMVDVGEIAIERPKKTETLL